ncbi:MAG: type II toxin-antitoxin system MqsA family antitoxin [Thermodesulfobacteriota bacterium]|nr:type II toxin-antitoxin system MqsA family antitoxin [Thermodesulfobacteriota bacterium]
MNKCYSCGENIQVIKDKPYHYTECGLDVVLCGITQYVCPACGEKYASIPNMQKLHRFIGTHICQKRRALLKPEEIKFLRKDLQLKSKELANLLGVTPSTISRWENGKKQIGEPYDRLLRSIFMMYASEQANHIICGGVELFKELPAKRKKIDQPKELVLNPQEWLNCFPDCCPA